VADGWSKLGKIGQTVCRALQNQGYYL